MSPAAILLFSGTNFKPFISMQSNCRIFQKQRIYFSEASPSFFWCDWSENSHVLFLWNENAFVGGHIDTSLPIKKNVLAAMFSSAGRQAANLIFFLDQDTTFRCGNPQASTRIEFQIIILPFNMGTGSENIHSRIAEWIKTFFSSQPKVLILVFSTSIDSVLMRKLRECSKLSISKRW